MCNNSDKFSERSESDKNGKVDEIEIDIYWEDGNMADSGNWRKGWLYCFWRKWLLLRWYTLHAVLLQWFQMLDVHVRLFGFEFGEDSGGTDFVRNGEIGYWKLYLLRAGAVWSR